MIKFIRTFNHDLPLPKRGSPLAAGMDLCAAEDVIIYAGQRYAVSTGWAWDPCFNDIYGRIAPRSGLALKHGIDCLAGVVDADYQGEIKVLLVNLDERRFEIKRGDRIAQLIVEHCFIVDPVEGVPEEIGYSERGQNGFGSTGV